MLPLRLRATFVILCLACGTAYAQNLVPNPSFETYNTCPSSLLSMPYSGDYTLFPSVTNWANPVKMSSPDYLNVCAANASGLKLPNSVFGYQVPRTGNAYTGIIAWEANIVNGNVIYDYREYLQNKLSQPLTAGKQYCVTFYVSPTISPGLLFNFISIDEIGIDFSPHRTIDTQHYVLSLNYDVKNPAGRFLTDTSKWYKVSGVYTAAGGEEWLTMGCFKGPNAPAYLPAYPLTPQPNSAYRSYLFIDDVSVREITPADTVIAAHDTAVCQANNLNIPLSGTADAVSYTWNNGATSASRTISDTGSYWCRSVTDCGLRIDTFHITFGGQKLLNLGNDTVNCTAQPIVLKANYTYSSYLWSTGATGNTITVTNSGTYVLTVSDKCGVQKDTINVTIQSPTPAPVTHDTIICQNDIMPALSVDGVNIRWYQAGGGPGTLVQPYIYTTQYGNQVVYVTQTIGKCESVRVPLNIKIKYKPNADIGDYYAFCVGQDTLIGSVYPDVNYLWNTNEAVCCVRPRETGTYELTIFNNCGISSDTAFVEISACDECLFMPNAFTPNRDGRNDQFSPVIKCPVSNFRMTVYNRWGEQVFVSYDVNGGWDGTCHNINADGGSYVYLLEYRSENTKATKHLRGNFILIR